MARIIEESSFWLICLEGSGILFTLEESDL